MTRVATFSETGVFLSLSKRETERYRVVDPTRVFWWDKDVGALPGCSFFHSAIWSQILAESYGHRPFYLCFDSDSGLTGTLPLMEVVSPLTGRRGVALPLTEFSPMLAPNQTVARGLLDQALTLGQVRGWRYLELRGIPEWLSNLKPSACFLCHEVDLTPGPVAMFQRMDPSAQHAVQKAQKCGVEVETSHSADSIRTFYRLHCQNRKRYGVPPQPEEFFRRVGKEVVDAGDGFVTIARWMGQPVAAGVFFQMNRQIIYKYGARDETYQSVRPANLLFWHVMASCSERGFQTLHLGRSVIANEELCRFKRSLGGVETKLRYARFHFGRSAWITAPGRQIAAFQLVLRNAPMRLLRGLGRLLYPHVS